MERYQTLVFGAGEYLPFLQLLSLRLLTSSSLQHLRDDREITPSDWERFDFYAQRVYKLECHQYYAGPYRWDYLEPAVASITRLHALKGGSLLPNIQNVTWTYRDVPGASFTMLESLFTPNLTSLDLIFQREGQDKLPRDLIMSIPAHCRYLRRFRLYSPLGLLDIPSLHVLQQCKSLNDVTIVITSKDDRPGFTGTYAVDPEVLEQLASFSTLSELRMIKGATYARPDISRPSTFPAVKMLFLDVGDTSSATGILAGCIFPSLKKLHIFYRLSEPRAAIELPELVRSQVSCDTLEVLTIDHTRWRSTQEIYGDIIIPSSSLHSLLDFRNMRVLNFRPQFGISLTDADLEMFARAWPHLSTLHIVGEPGIEAAADPARPTYKGIAHLVRLCLRLTTLDVVIAETTRAEAGPSALDDLPESPNHVLLGFNHSPLTDADFAASWILKMFPSVAPLAPRNRYTPIPVDLNALLVETWDDVFKMVERRRA